MQNYLKPILLILHLFINSFIGYSQHPACGNHECISNSQRAFIASNLEHQKTAFSRTSHEVEVVFHVLYNNDQENIPDSVIYNQLEVLNQDFNRTNTDASNTREIFEPIAGSMDIEFVLATEDPEGNPTNGINRVYTPVEGFFDDVIPSNFNLMKNNLTGGADAWNVKKYINIWICDLSVILDNINLGVYIVGYATWPLELGNSFMLTEDEFLQFDGVVIHYEGVGPGNPSAPPSGSLPNNTGSLGRLLTHEMGHYFGLFHVWGNGDCSMDDGIMDTPPMSDPTSSLASGTVVDDCTTLYNIDSCPDDMMPDNVENYMNYIDDQCMNMFTKQQVTFMESVLYDYRVELLDEPTSVTDANTIFNSPIIWPNPTEHFISLHQQLSNHKGVIIRSINGSIVKKIAAGTVSNIDITMLAQGLYFVEIALDNKLKRVEKFIKT